MYLTDITVNEADPLDQEIAVDPEMFGKVFKNLLDKKKEATRGLFILLGVFNLCVKKV